MNSPTLRPVTNTNAPTPAARPRVMPDDAYGNVHTDAGRDNVDIELRAHAHLIPTTPGQYRDPDGLIWTLDDQNRWTDADGVQRPASHTPIMGLFIHKLGPWVPVPAT